MAQRNAKPQDRSDEVEADAEDWDEFMKREPVVDWTPYISIDPNIVFGKPAVTGTRLAVEFVLELFALGWTEEQVLESYPDLTQETLRAIFAYAAELAHERQQRPAWMTDPSAPIEPGPRALPR